MLDFLPDTREIREGDWTVAPVPPDLEQRWVEITGPTDRKMTINALNSGADGFMADFEDANSPTWRQHDRRAPVTCADAIDGTISYRDPDGKPTGSRTAPRRSWCGRAAGTWSEKHLLVESSRCPARCSTSACTSFHNATSR